MNRLSHVLIGILAAILLVGCFSLVTYHEQTLRHGSFTSGYFLLGSVVFLAAFQVRKKLTFLPIGSAANWLRVHVFIGVLSMAIFALHVGIRVPNGVLEIALFSLFVLVTLSGLVGLYLSQTVPRRLSKLRDEFIYERIPFFRARVRKSAHKIVLGLLEEAPADTVADFYTMHLTEFFVRPRGWWYFLRPTSRLRNRLKGQLADLERYFSPAEREAGRELGRLIDRRDDLDYHAALQGVLKYWMFCHIGLTYALVVLASVHSVMVHAFFGGIP